MRQNSNVYIGLDGCLQEFDVLAQQFASVVGEQAETIIQRTENAIADIPTDDKVSICTLALISLIHNSA